jgi:hypothetical protein
MTVSGPRSAYPTPLWVAILCIVLATITGSKLVCAELSVTMNPEFISVSGGDVFDVDVLVDDSGVSFNGFDLKINYDPTRLTYIGQPISALAGSLMTSACPSSPFHIFQVSPDSTTISVNYIMLCSGVTTAGPGEIYTLRFQAKYLSGITNLDFLTGTNFYDAGMRVNPLATIDGSINIGFTSAVEDLPLPAALELRAAPNPFNPATRVSFDLPEPGEIILQVFDARGRRVDSLINGWRDAGPVNVTWDGTNQRGRRQPGGVYLFALEYGKSRQRLTATQKVVLLP